MSLGKSASDDFANLWQGLSKRQIGTCVSIDWAAGLVVVNLPPGGQVEMPMAGGSAPVPQQSCLVGFFGQVPICLGPVTRPPLGVVTGAPSGGLLPVRADDGALYQLAYDSTAPQMPVGSRVLIEWNGGGTVLMPLSADPYTHDDLIPDPVVLPSQPSSRTETFHATTSGTQNSGKPSFWTPQVYCGDTTTGGYIYGNQIEGTIPDDAEIVDVQLNVDAVRTTGNNPTVGLHGLSDRSGVLVVDQAVTVPGGSGWKQLPKSFGDLLKTGARKGVGTAHGGFHIWGPAGQNASGDLTITWRTN